jgi:hypothetical protein
MLACRLCLAFGEQDPEQWLELAPRRVVNVWRAFAQAEGWFTERYLAAITATGIKRLVALKYDKDAIAKVLEGIDAVANAYMPLDMQWTEEAKQIDPNVLVAMNRGGESVSTPNYTTEIDIEVDPWARQ